MKNLKDSKYVFLDFDGTLVDSVSAFFDVYISFLKKYGREGSKEEFDKNMNGPTIPQIVTFLRTQHNLPGSEEKLLEEYEEQVARIYAETVKPFDFAEGLLMGLNNKKDLALVTSSKEKYISKLFKKLDWKKYFNFLVFSDVIKNAKPDPEIYFAALDRAKVDPLESVVIEDSSNGVLAGKNAGIPVIGVSANETYRKKLKEKGADVVVSNLREVLRILI